MKAARTPGAYASAITHVGRRSGRGYETPAGPFVTDDGFMSPSPMFADRTTARKSAIWVGVLWIMATVFPVSSIVPWSVLDDGEGILANAGWPTCARDGLRWPFPSNPFPLTALRAED